jgi:hypothetical protein
MTPSEAAAIIGYPDSSLPKEMQCHQLANRAFRHLNAYDSDQRGRMLMWRMLVKAVQEMRPEWICEGPYEIADFAYAYTGPNGYLMIFRKDGKVFLTRGSSNLSPSTRPSYRAAVPLDVFVVRMMKTI